MKKILQLLKKFRLAFIALAIVGYALVSYSFADNYFEISKNLDIFSTMFRELNIYYVDSIQPGKLMKTGMDAMLASLDPYTDYIPESEIEDYRFMTTGQYGGIGALIRQKGDYIYIAEPYEGYPAQKAGLMAGDKILEIDGVSVKGKNADEIGKFLKGQPNTSIKMLVERNGQNIEKTVQREEIKISSVPYYGMVSKNTGYIRLTSFTENCADSVQHALITLKKNPDFKYLIFDLRGNPGGLLNEAVDMVNIFEPKGQLVVNTIGKMKEWDHGYKTLNPPTDLTTHIIVLVNGGSASAAEITSGTIQDLDRGVIMGQRSFGKGLVQQTRPLSYNAELKLTVAKYYIPSGRCIQKLDYSHRTKSGTVEDVPDSLITAFRTKDGRIVYDGCGIDPDVKFKQEFISNIELSLINNSLIFDFATQYRNTHPTIPPVANFTLTDKDFDNFLDFIKDKNYDYTTKSEEDLSKLKADTKKEKYFDGIAPEFTALENKIKHDKKADLEKNKTGIMELLEGEIVSRYYYQEGRQADDLKWDPEIKDAVALLNDSTRYDSILTTIAKPIHPFHDQKVGLDTQK
ncbi:MAG TPA: S41 family peptidase [Bacteroidia bacterium]|nr:S41 family peptidase [Bacteroidia bacterium]